MSEGTPERFSVLADQERARILQQEILGRKAIHFQSLPEALAAEEISRFSTELWKAPNMDGYFDRGHMVHLREHQAEAQHGFTTLQSGGIAEVISIPTMPEETMGFQILGVFDPRDEADRGRVIGYALFSLEREGALLSRTEAVRLAFDIFPPYREGRYHKVPFTNHEIYNICRQILMRFKPSRFVVDARTQILQTRTGNPFKRTAYYVKRGYYPPDQKPLTDACLGRLIDGKEIGHELLTELMEKAKAQFWVFPVGAPAPATSQFMRTSSQPGGGYPAR